MTSKPVHLRQMGQGREVAAGQVGHVDVVAHAGAVNRGVVVAEDVDVGQLPRGHARQVGHEVVGQAPGVVADEARGVRADGVEVAQAQHPQGRVGGACIIGQDFFDVEFAAPIGVGGGGGVLFVQRQVAAARHRRWRWS
jgi:hypothetical protein